MANQVQLCLRRLDALPRLLLEGMKHVDDLGELNRERRAVRGPFVIVDNFKDACATEASQRFA